MTFLQLNRSLPIGEPSTPTDTVTSPTDTTGAHPVPASDSARTTWRRSRLPVQIAAVVLVAALTVVTVDLMLDNSVHDTVSVSETIDRLEIDVDGGSVEIVATDDHATWIDVTTHGGLAAPHRSETVFDATLVLETSCPMISTVTCGVDYVIHVPRSVDIVASGGGTDYTMSGLGGDVDVSLSGGDAVLSFRTTPHVIRCQLSGGDLTVTVPPGDAPRVRADSSGGSVRVGIATDPSSDRSIDIHTLGGDIDLQYPNASAP